MKDKVNGGTIKEPEDLFIEEAKEALEVKKNQVVYWYCGGRVFVWKGDDGNIIIPSEILPGEIVRFIESIFDEAFIRKKLVNACRKAGLKVYLANCNIIGVSKSGQ